MQYVETECTVEAAVSFGNIECQCGGFSNDSPYCTSYFHCIGVQVSYPVIDDQGNFVLVDPSEIKLAGTTGEESYDLKLGGMEEGIQEKRRKRRQTSDPIDDDYDPLGLNNPLQPLPPILPDPLPDLVESAPPIITDSDPAPNPILPEIPLPPSTNKPNLVKGMAIGTLYENELQTLSQNSLCSFAICKADARANKLEVDWFRAKYGMVGMKYNCLYNPHNYTQVIAERKYNTSHIFHAVFWPVTINIISTITYWVLKKCKEDLDELAGKNEIGAKKDKLNALPQEGKVNQEFGIVDYNRDGWPVWPSKKELGDITGLPGGPDPFLHKPSQIHKANRKIEKKMMEQYKKSTKVSKSQSMAVRNTNANTNNIEATIPVNLKSKSASNHLETATTNSIANSTYAAATGTRLITQQSLPVGMLNTVGEESNSGYEAAPNGNAVVGQGNPAYQSTDF